MIPIVNYVQGSRMAGPVFCRPGHIPVPTSVPGQSKCVRYSAPSGMIGPQPDPTVGMMIPPSYGPGQRTFPVGPFWGWKEW